MADLARVMIPAPVVCPETADSGDACRKSAEIRLFTRARLPEQVPAFGRVCARLIWDTFPGNSQNAKAMAASRMLGISPDTIGRLLDGTTRHPDMRLMFGVLMAYQARTGRAFELGGGLAIYITQTGGAP